MDVVGALANNSLLSRLLPAPEIPDADADSRFGMLETIREYALEQLATQPEAGDIHQRHARYYLALAEAAAGRWGNPDADGTIARLDREHDNLRAVLKWARDMRHTTIGLQVAGALTKFWQRRGYLSEGRIWLEDLLSVDDDARDTSAMTARLHALEGAARLATHQYDFARSTARANLCDADAIEWLLDLGNNWDRIDGFRRRLSLILTITSNAEGTEPAHVKQLKKRDEIRPNLLQLTLPYTTAIEFTTVFAWLIHGNLNATFDSSLNTQEQAKIAERWYKITNGNWYLLREGAMYIDEELGASQGSELRRITADVLDRAEKRFQRT